MGGAARWRGRNRARCHFAGCQGDDGAVVHDIERVSPEQAVASLPLVHFDPNTASSEEEVECQAGELPREPGCEA